MTENELYHHGILGMKWGIRRYQNKDGSLTPLGKKHLRKLKDEVSKLEGTENKTEHPIDTSAYRRRDVKKLTDAEINERIERLKLEKKYKDALPDDRSRGKKFVQDILGPALKKGVKDYTGKLVDSASDALGTFGGKKIKDAINERLGVKKELLDSSQYRLSDIDNLTTEQLKARNERMKEEKSYREHFLGESKKDKSSDNNSGSKNDKSESSNNNSDSKKTKNENQNKSAESKREDEESKEQRSQVSDLPKVKTSDYDVDNDKNYYRVPSRGEHDMVIYRRQPVIDFTSRYEEAALSEVRPSSSGRSFVEERLLLPNPDDPRRMRHSDMETWRDELYHHGIKGQKWGVRRFQNPDGTLTEAGRKRGARTYNKALRREDRQRAYAVGRLQFANYTNKTNPTSDTKKAVGTAKSDIEKRRARAERLVSQAIKDGYTVNTKDIARGTSKIKEWQVRTSWSIDKTNYFLQEVNNRSFVSNGDAGAYGTARARTGMLSFTPGTAYKVRKKK